MNKKIIIVGSCMVDLVSYAPRLPKQGETLKGSSFIVNQGGKGANQCMAAAKLGGDTVLIAKLGADQWADRYLEVLKSYNVDVKFMRKVTGYSCGIAQIMVSESIGDNCIVIIPGANDTLSYDDVMKAEDEYSQAAVLVCQLETPTTTTLEALGKFKGISILNGAPADPNINPELYRKATIFCINETEASVFTGLPVESIEEAKTAIKVLKERGCNTVILTLGEKGALFSERNSIDIHYVSTSKATPVDTTGAGDAFIGSLAYLLAEKPNMPLSTQISIACYLASESVKQSGTHTSFAGPETFEKILQRFS